MVLRRAENIYPGLYEPSLHVPGVDLALLVGVPAADGDERLVAVVQPHRDADPARVRDALAAPLRRMGTARPDTVLSRRHPAVRPLVEARPGGRRPLGRRTPGRERPVTGPLRESSDDVELLDRAREHSDPVVRVEHLVVRAGLRRVRARGARRTLLWYRDRRYLPADEREVHVR